MKKFKWTPPGNWTKIKTIDLHTGGEPLRVIIDGLPELEGETLLDKRRFFKNNLDHIRKALMWEPRGHADMYGAVITEPNSGESDFGSFFLHNEGYSTMCGHAVIALTTLAAETDILMKKKIKGEILIDAPCGQISASAEIKNSKVQKVSFKNVPSFVLLKDKTIDVPGIGEVKFDISYGGAFYAFCEAAQLELDLEPENLNKIIDWGRRIKKSVMENFEIKHPFEKDLSFLYGTIFTDSAKKQGIHSRNVCIFADGEVDRSATGSGVSARAALHRAKGELNVNEKITIESIIGTTMDVKIHELTKFGGYEAVIPEVSGNAFITGINEFLIDPDDNLKKGFILR